MDIATVSISLSAFIFFICCSYGIKDYYYNKNYNDYSKLNNHRSQTLNDSFLGSIV